MTQAPLTAIGCETCGGVLVDSNPHVSPLRFGRRFTVVNPERIHGVSLCGDCVKVVKAFLRLEAPPAPEAEEAPWES